MKTIMDLFYETYSPRQKYYGLTMSLKETGTQCYHNATKDLIRRFPIEQKTERVG